MFFVPNVYYLSLLSFISSQYYRLWTRINSEALSLSKLPISNYIQAVIKIVTDVFCRRALNLFGMGSKLKPNWNQPVSTDPPICDRRTAERWQ